MNWEALSDELDRIFQAQGRNEQLMFKNLYESAYRGESMVNVHGSLAGLGGHLIDGADWFGVRPGQGGQWSQR